MNVQATLQCMQKMKLTGMADSYQAISHLPADKQPTTHQCIATLVDAELQSRANTKVIQEYLGRYICRIGLSKNKFHYDKVHKEVTLKFKDSDNQA